MKDRDNQRCTKCLMPRSYPGIFFDQDGVCNQCREFKRKDLLGEESLLRVIRSKKGKEYDCIVGISGGKDSCYVAYLARKRYNLKGLAVCYDFPFLCDLARQNVKRVCNALDLDLLVIKSKDDLEYRLLRNHFLSVGLTGTSWGQCLFCHYGIEAILHKIAREKGIPIILGGVTKYELWNPGSRTHFLKKRVKNLALRDKAKFAFYQAKAYSLLLQQRREFPIPGNSCFDVYRRTKSPQEGPMSISVFDYVKWDQRMIEKTLRDETGWTKPDKSISWRYDCILEPFLDYTYKREFGVSTVGIYLSHLIRDGLISREEALGILEKSEDEDRLRESLSTVFEFLKLPKGFDQKFFQNAVSR